MDVGRTKYLIPNALTVASLCAGVYSIHLSTSAQSVSTMLAAGWLIAAATVLDAFDGRIARWARAESRLGGQLDSLADAVSFGVAPAFLIYEWGLSEWGPAGMAVACGWVCCAVVRLARFHARPDAGRPRRYFVGLPAPVAAGAAVSTVLAHVSRTGAATTQWSTAGVAAGAVLLAGLMTSHIEYRTFKNAGPTRGSRIAAVVAVATVSLSVVSSPYVTFAVLIAGYVVLGAMFRLVSGTTSASADRRVDEKSGGGG